MSELHPEGYFDAEVIGGKFGQTGNGKAQWGIEVGVEGVTRTVFLSFEGGSKPYTIEKLQRIGFNGDVDNPTFALPRCQVQCKHEEWEGKWREKWDLARGLEVADPTPDQKTAFKREWKATAAAPVSKPAGAPTAPPARSAPAASSDGPPARQSAPPAPKKDKTWAWNELKKTCVPTAANFNETLERIEKESGKNEEQFLDAQWDKVVGEYIGI